MRTRTMMIQARRTRVTIRTATRTMMIQVPSLGSIQLNVRVNLVSVSHPAGQILRRSLRRYGKTLISNSNHSEGS